MPQPTPGAAYRPALAIALGAIAGSLCRYFLGAWLNQSFSLDPPYSTLIVNVSGCFLMGILATLSLDDAIRLHPEMRLLLLTGFLGSYTTFSSYELDSAKLLQQKGLTADLTYWLGSVMLGFTALRLGIILTEWILSRFASQDQSLEDIHSN